ncbi:MAG TPA: cytochrome c4 [Leucothrix mucor]|uniref:Cytochrome c4 n=1 Tax=Leucothrix mucor TaxID=45248 RepID=A0A7V2SXV8_LEUMU|nr:cytochrome c4 [Leucothrix mucor]
MNKALIIALVGLALTTSASVFASGDAAKGKALTGSCVACHGADGNSVNPIWPKLAGQSEEYLIKQLNDFRSGERIDATMTAMAKAIASDDDIPHIAAYFASQKQKPGVADDKLVDAGRQLYKGGRSSSKVTACAACHGVTGNGIAKAKFPKISGQHNKYIVKQLKAFKAGKRANDPGKMMRNIAYNMTDSDMKAVAEFITGLRD